jgi:hypothetical protein
MPLANGFLTTDELSFPEPRFDLSVARCGNCGLIQVPDVIDPLVLFGHYSYFSSYSAPTVEHFRSQALLLHDQYITDPSELICEIGSNDGIFLRNVVGKCRLIGIDPADNIADIAATRGVTTIQRFFNPRTAAAIRTLFGPAKIIFAANCIAHIDDINGVLEGIAHLLDDEGVLVFENHRFVDMLRSRCFDQIYHEHLCYYTLQPIEHLLAQHGMRVIEARTLPTHGESFQIHAVLKGSSKVEHPNVEQIRGEEAGMGLGDPKVYADFAADVSRLRSDLRDLLLSLKSQGKRIVGYGAPGKSTTLLNYCGIDHTILDYIIDSTPIKQGRYTPGTRIPIVHPQRLREDPPDYALLMAWNYADAILENERAMRDRGVKFIVPVPTLRIV